MRIHACGVERATPGVANGTCVNRGESFMMWSNSPSNKLTLVHSSLGPSCLRHLVLRHRHTGGHSRWDFKGRIRGRHRVGRRTHSIPGYAASSGCRDHAAHPLLHGPVRSLGLPQALGSAPNAIFGSGHACRTCRWRGHGRFGERSCHPPDRRVDRSPVRSGFLVQSTAQSPACGNKRPEGLALGHDLGLHELHQPGGRSAAADVPPAVADG